jgi:hemolysin activation/secretion protein
MLPGMTWSVWKRPDWAAPLTLAGFTLAGVALVTHPARAQLSQNPLPPSLPNVPQQSPLPHIEPVTPPSLGAGLPNFSTGGTEGPLPSAAIPVQSVSIVGATAFPPYDLNAATRGLAQRTVPLSQIEAARRALVDLYRSHGYVLTTVSLDIDAQGNVRFIVTEGRIVAVKLSQDIGPAGTMVLRFLNHLTEERPVSEASLERWLLLAQQIPGVSVHAVLQAEAGDPGALTLVAEVAKQNFSGLLTADNRSFTDTGPAEGLVVADLNSATSLGDQTELSLFHTSAGTDNFGQASTSAFIGSDGLRIKLYGGTGRSQPGGILREIDYHSTITVFGGELSYPVLLRRNQALTLNLRADAVQNLIIASGARSSSDSLRVLRFDGQYVWQDLLLGDTRDALNVLNVQESTGLPILGASGNNRPAGVAGRGGEVTDFWKINGSVSRTQTLFSPAPDATVALRLETGGQYASEVLPSEEEFYLGGSRFTRGYYSGQVTGDKALYATAELQLNTGYNFSVLKQNVDLGVQYYVFYDDGETWSNLKTDLPHRIASAGGGVRIGLTRNLEVDGEAVDRLTTRLVPANTGTAPLKELILYWGVTARY